MFVSICGVDQLSDPRTSVNGPVSARANTAPAPKETAERSVDEFGVASITGRRESAIRAAVTFARAEPSDAPAIEAMLERCSRRSRTHRFFRPVASAPPGYLDHTLSERDAHMAFLVRIHGQVVGLAELHRTGSHGGDIGLIIEDAYHGKGVGTAAYALLVDVARRLGIQTLTADVRVENFHVFKALRRAGRTSVTRDHDVCHVEVHLGDVSSGPGPLEL